MSNSFLTRSEAANYLKLKPQTLGKWASIGNGPAYVKVGRSVRYRLADLERWLERRTVGVES